MDCLCPQHVVRVLRLKARDVVLFGYPRGAGPETGFTTARKSYSTSGVFPAVGDSFILARQFLPKCSLLRPRRAGAGDRGSEPGGTETGISCALVRDAGATLC